MATHTSLNTQFKIALAEALGLDPSNVYELHLNINADGSMNVETKQFIKDYDKLYKTITQYILDISGVK